jgi:hypothetical protein
MTMELRTQEIDVFHPYLAPFTALAGDQRTARLIGETVRGIIGSESLCCSRIAAFSPWTGCHAARGATDSAHGAW